jgi:DNA repair protein RadC
VEGVGESAAVLLRLLPELSRRYIIGKTDPADPVDTPAAAGRFFIPRFLYETEEVVMALLLDARKRPLVCRVLSRGVVDAAEISARKLAQMCMERRASGVILAHNHLSGMALPSAEDEMTTNAVSKALGLLGVELCDHVIVAGCDYVSMRESRLIR